MERNCPICDSKNKSFTKKIDFVLFENHPMKNGYELVQCTNCSFIFANTSITQKELDDYYASLSKYEDKKISTGGGYNSYDKDRLVKTAAYIAEKFPNKEINIVDIGCAIGGLLEQLKKKGFHNLTGIDPSISCVKITNDEKKINCIHASIFDLEKKFGQYDLVILSHVWEHILDLDSAIVAVKTILKPEGFIYVECPNAMQYQNIIHAPFQEFNTEHINHFTENAFVNFFESRNFKQIDTGTKVMKIASGEDYEACYAIFKATLSSNTFYFKFDNNALPSIKEYIKKSEIKYSKILEEVSGVFAENAPVAFIGIGQFSFKLLKSIMSEKFKNKILLFDNNPLNKDKSIAGIKVLSGAELINEYKKESFHIIITSLIYQNEIYKDLVLLFSQNNLSIPIIHKLS